MTVRKFAITDVSFERSPGQQAGVFAGNVIAYVTDPHWQEAHA
jgi:hypothetical protein